MRTKDEEKQEALFEATVKVVNAIGFASSSVSKISKEAGLSPATLYIYHKNKEDLLIFTFMAIKRKLSEIIWEGVDETAPIRDCLRQVWFNLFKFTAHHTDYFQFAEQFSNSPYYDRVNQYDIDRMFTPFADLIRKGIRQKIIKDVEADILSAFVFYPVIILSNPRLCRNFDMTDKQVEQSFQLAWDAIKF
jgi:AcrR family transcriptional regulator